MKLPEFKDPLDLIRTINPLMSPEQAVEQIREFNRLEHNKTKVPVELARRKLLDDNGLSPDEWTYYSNTARLKGETDDDMMRGLSATFPVDVEFLVVQGAFLGGVNGRPGVDSSWGVSKYMYFSEEYTAFIRVRPRQLAGKK